VQPPGGESLKDTGARVWPYYLHVIQPHVLRGETVLVTAHGNSLRALIMALDGLSPEEIVKVEIATGVPIVYRLNADSTVASKEFWRADRAAPDCAGKSTGRPEIDVDTAPPPAYIGGAHLPRWRNW
jgi:bisphosphoglycerate-dependent phosphoglycerate mutase family 1